MLPDADPSPGRRACSHAEAADFAAWEAQWRWARLRRVAGAVRRGAYQAFIAQGTIWVPHCVEPSNADLDS